MHSSSKKAGVNKVDPNFQSRGELVAEPMPMDVLCGKSRKCISHEGTRLFRIVIDQYREKYQNAKSKQERMDITKEIVASIGRKGARFLKYNSSMQCWENIGTLAARDKCSHALRCANQKTQNSRKFKSSRSSSSVASDGSSVGSDSSIGSTYLQEVRVSDSLESLIGDQQTVLSLFQGTLRSSPDLPAANSLMNVFDNDIPIGGTSTPVPTVARRVEYHDSLLPEGHHQAQAPFPALSSHQGGMGNDNLPVEPLARRRLSPSPEKDDDEREKRSSV
ncbi:expressed unknown protein [Seminavis robusta]|uniref:DUF6824 domain-containing protein n=1 Tax=Seminavis robusta TaxID=568900 RepID=A0A9N8D739_9STRA|nr:expressed unknown protein [Seminavis robusta]|eukprot:Sro21_g015030.1 n/a (277) ;mRNA; f:170924-171964